MITLSQKIYVKIILTYNKWDEDRQTEEGCAKVAFYK